MLRNWSRSQLPALHLDFLREAVDPRLTVSGGANGTRVNSAGVIVAATTPRFDYNPTTLAARGLLIEEARTNLLLRSGELSNAVFSTNAVTKTAAAGVAPDGTTSATRLLSAGGGGSLNYCQQTYSTASGSGVSYTVSVYLKSNTGSNQTVRLKNTHLGVLDNFSSNLTVTTDWQRFTFTVTNGASAGTGQTMGIIEASTNAVFDVLAWGAQLEVGSGATTETPTTTATVARTADSAVMTGTNFSSWASSTSAFVVEFDVSSVSGTRPILSLDDNTANQQIRLYTSGTSLKLTVTNGGVTQADLTLGTVAANTTYKAGFRFAANDFAAVLSGGTVQTDAAGTVPTVDRMRIGSDQAGNVQNGHARYVRGYSTLTNAALQAYTS